MVAFSLVLLIAAGVVFILAALRVASPRVELIAGGLALYIASLVVQRFV